MRKLFFIFLAILLFTQNSFAGTGRADVYKITIRQIAMCETGSTLSNCLNPVVIFTGNSADIDIAATTAGAAAANLGSATAATIGTAYTHMQIVMNRAMKIAAGTAETISDGTRNCKTASGGDAGSATASAVGSATGDAGEQVIYAGVHGSKPGSNAFSSVSTITSVSGTANPTINGEEFFQWRVALTSPFVYDGIRNPNVQIAFSTEEAVGAAGTCAMFGAAPDVLITIN
ncbi:hypothetical protein OAM72_00135 [Pelagibacteraceae bacterium]|nr:hypothetical protein [Pelagibacteraceae bacterium]